MIPAILGLILEVASFAPSIASLFTNDSTAGKAAEVVADVAKVVTGKDITNPLEQADAVRTLKNNPEKLVEFQKLVSEQVIQVLQLEVQDRANAREREIKTGDKTPRQLAFFLIGSFVSFSFCLLLGAFLQIEYLKNPVVAGNIGAILGFLANECKTISVYYFGSSMGSKVKDEQILNLTKRI